MEYDETQIGCIAVEMTEMSVDDHECCCCCGCDDDDDGDDDRSSIVEFIKLFSLHFGIQICITEGGTISPSNESLFPDRPCTSLLPVFLSDGHRGISLRRKSGRSLQTAYHFQSFSNLTL